MPCGDILLNMRKSGFGIGLVSIILSMVLPLANATEIRAWTADELDGCNFGLTFRSHKYPLDERTGLNLTPDRHLNLSHGFSIDFDLCLNREDAAYGYVMRLISGNRSALDINANINTGNLISSLSATATNSRMFRIMMRSDLKPDGGCTSVCPPMLLRYAVQLIRSVICSETDFLIFQTSKFISEPALMTVFIPQMWLR